MRPHLIWPTPNPHSSPSCVQNHTGFITPNNILPIIQGPIFEFECLCKPFPHYCRRKTWFFGCLAGPELIHFEDLQNRRCKQAYFVAVCSRCHFFGIPVFLDVGQQRLLDFRYDFGKPSRPCCILDVRELQVR